MRLGLLVRPSRWCVRWCAHLDDNPSNGRWATEFCRSIQSCAARAGEGQSLRTRGRCLTVVYVGSAPCATSAWPVATRPQQHDDAVLSVPARLLVDSLCDGVRAT